MSGYQAKGSSTGPETRFGFCVNISLRSDAYFATTDSGDFMMLEARSDYQPGSLWFYAPNKGAPIAFAILFTVSGITHGYQCFHYKSWKVTGLFPWSAILFSVGFVTRAVAAFGAWDNLNVFIVSSFFLLAAPPVYEGANFFTLGRILYYIPYHSPIHPGRVFSTFVAMGVVIEAVTGNGAALVANTEAGAAQRERGEALLKAALIMQLALMVGFVSLAGRFHYNCAREGVLNQKLKRVLTVLYTSCTLITIRTIYRTVEYFSVASLHVANDSESVSPIITDEWFFWVFETVVMFTNTAMLNVFHPMRWLPRSNKIYLAKDGVTEIEGPGYEDRRNFLLTIVDPFDVVGLVTKRGKQEHYWEDTTNSNSDTQANPSKV